MHYVVLSNNSQSMDYHDKDGRGSTTRLPKSTGSSDGRRTSSSSASSSRDIVLAHRELSKHDEVRIRKKKPKTKTGCITCKYRRVKCDEGKPHCQRCLKFGVDCEGYASEVKPLVRVSKARVLLPRGASRRIPQLFEVPPISKIHAGFRFADEIESQCFRVYLDQTAKQIQGPFQSSLWEKLIPQMSEMEPFVRHAIIAIGALGKQKEPQLHYNVSYPANPASGYEYALKQYGRSLRGMRDAISSGQHDIRKALIACILVFCFEGLLGNQASAAAHAESGLNLLYRWKNNNTPSNRFLEASLIDAFTALDLQVLFFIDHRSPTIHHDIKASLSQTIESMPQEFESLDSARLFWQLIIRRNFHFNKAIQGIDLKTIQEDREDTPWEGSANMPPGELLLSPAKDEPLSLKEEQLRYRKDIDQWSAASTSLFKRVRNGQSEPEMVSAAILQIQAKTNRIMLAATFFATEMAYDIFTPEFAAIVTLSEYVYPRIVFRSDDSAAPRFHHDIAIVPPLYLAATKCRVDAIRQKAIALLFSANFREGIWDAPAVGHMAVWLRSVEREGLDNGQMIPEEKRAFLTAINCDLHNKRAILSCGQRTKDGLVSRNTLLTW